MIDAAAPPAPEREGISGSGGNGRLRTFSSMSTAIEFDFAARKERTIPAAQAKAACDAGLFCWIDFDAQAEPHDAEAMLREMGVNDHAIKEALGPDVDGRHDLYDDCLHIAVTSARLIEGKLQTSHVDIIAGERFLITLRRGQVDFIDQVKRQYKQDFHRFAKTGSFLLYEYWDALIATYKKTIRGMSAQVERFQDQIFGEVSDTIFNDVSAVTRDLLSFRKIMLAAREVLPELSSRKSPFVSENTQPFLEKMVDTLERLGADIAVERDILSETLNLYMGIVSHRTNKVVSRLTVISVVFLPLTFLCGVYGMNFDTELMMPELSWKYGYRAFWIVALFIAVGLLTWMKRRRWW